MKAFLLRLLQSCNPNTYSDLIEEKIQSSWKHFFKQFLVLFLLMAILFVPAYFINADVVGERLSAFTSADINGDFASAEPVTLIANPRITFDENATNADGSWVVFGNDAVYYKQYYWFGDVRVAYTDFRNLTTLDSTLIAVLAIFLLPALVFWSGVYLLIKIFLFIRIFSLLGWLVSYFFKHSLKLKHSAQVALYAAVPALIVEMVLFPFWRNMWITLVLYIVFFGFGIAIVSEKKLKK